MADHVEPQVSAHLLLCSRCGEKQILQSRPKFCPECGKNIDDKDIKPFPLAAEPSQSGGSGGEYQGSTNDQLRDGNELSSGTSQLSSGESGSTSRDSQIVDTVTHPLGTDDQSSSSQPSSYQAHNQRDQGVHDQSYKATQNPQDAYSQIDQNTHGHDTHEDACEKDSGTHNQPSNTHIKSHSGQDQSASLVSCVVC